MYTTAGERRRSCHLPIHGAFFCLSATIAGSTFAAPTQPQITLPDIVVEGQGTGSENPRGPVNGIVATRTETGTKTNTPRIEIPQSISIIGRKQIDLTGSRSLGEATRYTPGVRELFSGADTRFDQFQIRGFNATSTGLYLDGLQLLESSGVEFHLEPYGLERIEVLRGPSSVLYGGSNPGGLINAVSKRPTDRAFGQLTTGINSFGNAYLGFDIGGPVAHDAKSPLAGEFSYRLTGIGRTGGTQYDFSDDTRGFIAPALTWRPDPVTSLTILTSYQSERTTNVSFLPYLGTVTPAPFGRIPTNFATSKPDEGGTFNGVRRRQTLLGYQFERQMNETFTVRQNFRYSHSNTTLSGLIGFNYGLGSPTATQALLRRVSFFSSPVTDLFNVDNQVETRFRTGPVRHTLLTGIDYKHVVFDEAQAQALQTPIDILHPVYGAPLVSKLDPTIRAHTNQDQTGLYAQDQAKLDRFTLVLSGREDFVRTDFRDILTPAGSAASREASFSGRAGLIYTSVLGIAPYVSYSRSFQPLVGINDTTKMPLKPETGQQYEVGVKYQPDGAQSFVGVSLFDLTRQNFLTVNPTNPLLGQQNGEARSRGLEIEALANLANGLNLIGAFTTFDIKNTKNLDPTVIGLAPVNTPERYGSLFLDYTIQGGELRGFGAGYGVRYTDRAFADNLNTARIPSYVLSDAVIHFERGPWRAAINGFNLFNKAYVAQCSSVTFCFYGEPRKVLASLSYRW